MAFEPTKLLHQSTSAVGIIPAPSCFRNSFEQHRLENDNCLAGVDTKSVRHNNYTIFLMEIYEAQTPFYRWRRLNFASFLAEKEWKGVCPGKAQTRKSFKHPLKKAEPFLPSFA